MLALNRWIDRWIEWLSQYALVNYRVNNKLLFPTQLVLDQAKVVINDPILEGSPDPNKVNNPKVVIRIKHNELVYQEIKHVKLWAEDIEALSKVLLNYFEPIELTEDLLGKTMFKEREKGTYILKTSGTEVYVFKLTLGEGWAFKYGGYVYEKFSYFSELQYLIDLYLGPFKWYKVNDIFPKRMNCLVNRGGNIRLIRPIKKHRRY